MLRRVKRYAFIDTKPPGKGAWIVRVTSFNFLLTLVTAVLALWVYAMVHTFWLDGQ